jgi:two-component system chemotaxis response regulator CheB
MQSAAEVVEGPMVGVVLTGMGKDGAAGIEAIKEAGGTTFAQDEESSPVFGIPEQAIATGCVDHVLSAEEMIDGVLDALAKEGE